MAIRRLEELQCLNTAEVVILWAWTTGVVHPMDHNAWGSIERDTLLSYQTHGIGRLITLKRHIADTTTEVMHVRFLTAHYRDSPFRVGNARLLVPKSRPRLRYGYYDGLRISRACQLKRLYHLFGYDHATWKETVEVKVEEEDEEMDVSSGCPVTPVMFVDWMCDYP
ncbi:hypothetical protein BDM02DRAFT_3120592 [Thelephora ganbajun]|uniref:Uncharacterized protein n=1 Tax=Thelephora ganbajun TaxID=370292 RepID=A0ACB6Z6J1_THEGA|nr:hypothetical protein BDM02DRAFT_3120592 [Thelephora ganbajun]